MRASADKPAEITRHAHLAKSAEAVSGPRILYSIFAPWMFPTFGKRYGVGVAYAIRILGLNNQIYSRYEILAAGWDE